MDTQQRYNLIRELANWATDGATHEALMDFSYEAQVEILDEKSDDELLTFAEQMQ